MKILCLALLLAAQLLGGTAAVAASFDDVKKEAEQGEKTAQLELGSRYSLGEGVAPDAKKAFRWFKKSAEQSYPRPRIPSASCTPTASG